jgi:LMBR1-like membrane protein
MESLINLNAAIKNQIMETKRREVTYEQVLEQAFFIEDVLRNRGNENHKLESNLIIQREGRVGRFIDTFEFYWHTVLRPKFFWIVCVVAIILSLQLVVGELIILFKFNFSLFDLIPQTTNLGKLVGYGFSLVFLLYMSLCIYYGLFNIKFTTYYELHSNKQTDPFSLLYSANFLTKLAPPLCFNFLKLINVQGTAFHRMLGGLDPIPLIGEDFQKLFPATLLLLVFFNAFDFWGKMMKCLGLEDF